MQTNDLRLKIITYFEALIGRVEKNAQELLDKDEKMYASISERQMLFMDEIKHLEKFNLKRLEKLDPGLYKDLSMESQADKEKINELVFDDFCFLIENEQKLTKFGLLVIVDSYVEKTDTLCNKIIECNQEAILTESNPFFRIKNKVRV
jgi:hypothetical protein